MEETGERQSRRKHDEVPFAKQPEPERPAERKIPAEAWPLGEATKTYHETASIAVIMVVWVRS